MSEQEILLKNLERLRVNFGLNLTIINNLLKWGTHKYSRIHSGKQDPTLTDLIAMASLYNLLVSQLLSSELKIPNLNSISAELRTAASERIGKPDKQYVKRDLISHLIIILNTHFKINDTFTNLQIKCHLTWELQNHYKTKSIEWNKSILKEYVVPTKSTQKAATKSQIVYQLIRPITTKMVEHALKTIEKENIASENQSE